MRHASRTISSRLIFFYLKRTILLAFTFTSRTGRLPTNYIISMAIINNYFPPPFHSENMNSRLSEGRGIIKQQSGAYLLSLTGKWGQVFSVVLFSSQCKERSSTDSWHAWPFGVLGAEQPHGTIFHRQLNRTAASWINFWRQQLKAVHGIKYLPITQ